MHVPNNLLNPPFKISRSATAKLHTQYISHNIKLGFQALILQSRQMAKVSLKSHKVSCHLNGKLDMPIVAQSEATAIIQGDALVDYEPAWVQCNILLHPVVIIMHNGDVDGTFETTSGRN